MQLFWKLRLEMELSDIHCLLGTLDLKTRANNNNNHLIHTMKFIAT